MNNRTQYDTSLNGPNGEGPYDGLLFPGANLRNWQMSPAERIALTGVLARIRPKGAIEIGVYYGGSLSLISQFAQHIIGIDIDPQVSTRFERPSNAEICISESEAGITKAFNHFDSAGIPVNFVLVDADHSSSGIARDLRTILKYTPREPMVVLVHDSGNPGCRQGILSVDWASNPYCHEVEVDFVPGQIPEHSVNNGRGEVWGGFALVYFDPRPRVGPPVIRQSAVTSVMCLQVSANDLTQVLRHGAADGIARLRPGVELRPGSGLESALYEGWSAPERWGVWSLGSTAVMRVGFARDIELPATIVLDTQAFAPAGITQSVKVLIGQYTAKNIAYAAETSSQTVLLDINRSDLSHDFCAEIAFCISNPVSPAAYGLSNDGRSLGIAIKQVALL